MWMRIAVPAIDPTVKDQRIFKAVVEGDVLTTI
jgi:hypothetical protein